MKHPTHLIAFAALAAAFIAFADAPASAQTGVAQQFASPPDTARPETWWHWVSGNVTPEGITADLEAMKRIGLGGAQIFTVNQGPAGPVRYMSPEWRKLVQHAVGDAARLGLRLSITDCEGWSESGGPWITPELSMQKLVWTEARVHSGTLVPIVMAKPDSYKGYYEDVAVLAFPSPVGDDIAATPTATSSIGPLDLTGGPVRVGPPSDGSPAFVQLAYSSPVRFASLTLAPGDEKALSAVDVSDDGVHFRPVSSLRSDPQGGTGLTFTFDPVTAWFVRLSRTASSPVKVITCRRIEVGGARVAGWEAKAGAYSSRYAVGWPDAAVPADMAVDVKRIVDLTGKLDATGRLDWTPPPGMWTVLRFGHTSTGTTVHPAMPETVGLECDKLSRAAVTANWNGQMAKVIVDNGPQAVKALRTVLMDSWEAGTGNWTPAMPAEFRQRRGYDLLQWLPALTGRVIGDTEQTERFLWDYRLTMADLVAENHYGVMQKLAHDAGMLLQAEAPGIGMPTVANELQCKGYTDIPMGEFWLGSRGPLDDAREAASAAHTYGRTIAATESFTATPENASWTNDPYSIKALGDLAFCSGINRYSFHRYAMQPYLNKAPGMTMGPWGLNFERTNTWWEPGKAWISYISRCEYLLQQGLFVADVCYYGGEGAPNCHAESALNPKMPPGYDYDECDTEVLLHRASVKDGRLTLPDGMSYRILVLPAAAKLTPAVARKVRDLVAAGLTVVGPKPTASPSLAGYPGCDGEVRAIGAQVWGDCDGVKLKRHSYGKGTVVCGEPLDLTLATGPDFSFTSSDGAAKLAFIHRRLADGDYYFVSNQNYAAADVACSFRVSGRVPELWDPDSGRIERAAAYESGGDRTSVPIHFDPAGSVFIVFRQAAGQSPHVVSVKQNRPLPAPPAPTHDIRIVKATYGAGTTVDVAAAVASWLAGGMKPLTVGNEMAGSDPAPNIVKSLVVEYTIAGASRTATILEGQMMALPGVANPTGVSIIAARYGIPGGSADVTASVARIAASGAAAVDVTNDLVDGKDPAPNIAKRLDITYTVDGIETRRSVRENATLRFDDSLPPVAPPTFHTRLSEAGSAELIAWQPNTYSYVSASGMSAAVDVPSLPSAIPLASGWTLRFPAGWGVPDSLALDSLVSWTKLADDGARHFSGTAAYSTVFDVPASSIGANHVAMLDLGAVKNLAEVTVNGHNLGVLWKEPFRADISGVVKPGRNTLEVKVTNLWPNRLIGDAALPPEKRFTWTTFNPHQATSPLLPSGLLGPVIVRFGAVVPLPAK